MPFFFGVIFSLSFKSIMFAQSAGAVEYNDYFSAER